MKTKQTHKRKHFLRRKTKGLFKLMVLFFLSTTFSYGQTILISKGASWKYLDNGSDQGTSWRSSSFSDGTWKTGNAELGYGDGDEATVVSYGGSSSNKYITTYFRKAISIPDVSLYSSFTLNVKRDDGVVVYVNGTERYRDNMPTGTISYSTLASNYASDDGKNFQSYSLSSSNFISGTNIIAVEIHQHSNSSSDISFDLEIIGNQISSTSLIPKGASWRYLDNGSDQGTSWRSSSFNDGIWKTGNAELGYGDGDEKTVVNYGSNSSNKYITTYFRKAISISDVSLYSSFTLNVKRDDGVVVYVNGTERYRNNMPTGTISYTTVASSAASDDGKNYQTSSLSSSNFISGTNVIAVEVHQRSSSSSDISFDLELIGNTTSCSTVGCFTSVQPTAQTQYLVLPGSHTFQMIFKQGSTYSVGGGSVPGGLDFTGYVPRNGSSELGYISINHENNPGGVSVLDASFNTTSKLWKIDASQAVSFSSSALVKTERNCSGGITPWGTIISCEESRATGDANGDGYTDTGWGVEIDPATKTVKQYGNGKPEKLWALGRMSHENVVVASDNKTVYYGEDASDGAVYKFVANQSGNLSSGTLYTLKLSTDLSYGEPTSSTGSWIQVPNTSKSDRDSTYSLAISLGATKFNGVEDVEIASNGQIYFTSKGNGRVYRFTDNGRSISNFQTYVGGKSYTINYGSGSVSESWGTGNDNLAFDGDGNLWVLQDGGRNHIWVVKAGHTQASPKVELFATTPSGSEPTGITFSPDKRFMFISFQHPSSSNGSQIDASGASVSFNTAATIVIARKENLGTNYQREAFNIDGLYENEVHLLKVYPSPFDDKININVVVNKLSKVNIQIFDITGKEIVTVYNGDLNPGEPEFSINTKELKFEGKLLIVKANIDGRTYTRKISSK